MSRGAGLAGRIPAVVRDLITLTKPGITGMNVFAALGGAALAGGEAPARRILLMALGTGLAVACANVLNMVIEREGDKLMARTAVRPLPAGRMTVLPALSWGLLLGVFAVLTLLAVEPLTAAIGLAAIFGYAFVYTPLKRVTPLALVIGAIPGAAPPLMGWTAVTGSIGAPGLVLFAVLMIWQIPHFMAIALFRKDDYVRAGIRTVPAVRGDRVAKAQAIAWATALLPVSLALVPMGVAGWFYGVVAFLLGAWFLSLSVRGLRPDGDAAWARRFFFGSLIYLPTLCLALAVDVATR